MFIKKKPETRKSENFLSDPDRLKYNKRKVIGNDWTIKQIVDNDWLIKIIKY